jgi:hypothetical protein
MRNTLFVRQGPSPPNGPSAGRLIGLRQGYRPIWGNGRQSPLPVRSRKAERSLPLHSHDHAFRVIVKGFVINDSQLKNCRAFGQDYFDELLERIREIRASEHRAYQRIADVFEQCSSDYRRDSEETQLFYHQDLFPGISAWSRFFLSPGHGQVRLYFCHAFRS